MTLRPRHADLTATHIVETDHPHILFSNSTWPSQDLLL